METASPLALTLAPADAPTAAMAAELAEVRDDLNHLLTYAEDTVTDHTLTRAIERLDAIATRASAGPERRWSRIGLMDPAGERLWALAPPGTWTAEHVCEAKSWADLDELAAWLRDQPEDFRDRLATKGFRAVHLDTVGYRTFATPIPEAKAC